MYPIYYHNWGNINTICIYNNTSIKRNILTIKKKIHWEVGRAKDLLAARVVSNERSEQQIRKDVRGIGLRSNIWEQP
jgi:hypothetical protein